MFSKIGWKLLTISAKHAILNVWQGSEYASVLSRNAGLNNGSIHTICEIFWTSAAQKMKFSDEEILNGKLHFLCSAVTSWVDFPQAGDAIYKNLAKTVIESIFPLI